MDDEPKFAALLKAHRVRQKLSVRGVAQLLRDGQDETGIVSKWESGRRIPPNLDTCRKLVGILDIQNVDQFLDAAARERGKDDIVAYYEQRIRSLLEPTADLERNATKLYRALPMIFRDNAASDGLRSLLLTAANPPPGQDGSRSEFLSCLNDYKELPKLIRWEVIQSFCAAVRLGKRAYNLHNRVGPTETITA